MGTNICFFLLAASEVLADTVDHIVFVFNRLVFPFEMVSDVAVFNEGNSIILPLT